MRNIESHLRRWERACTLGPRVRKPMGVAWKALAAATHDSSAAHLAYVIIPVWTRHRDPKCHQKGPVRGKSPSNTTHTQESSAEAAGITFAATLLHTNAKTIMQERECETSANAYCLQPALDGCHDAATQAAAIQDAAIQAVCCACTASTELCILEPVRHPSTARARQLAQHRRRNPRLCSRWCGRDE